jgi:hypothetical protein
MRDLRQAPQLPFAHDNCRVWDVPKASERLRQVPTNSIPTLVLNGGHWSSARSPCANDVIASFYNDPTRKPDLSCVQALKAPPFA